jgi:hypothetical protein
MKETSRIMLIMLVISNWVYYIYMLKICLLVVLLAVSLAKPNKAGYIHGPGRPLNIAHRGLCSILP